MRGGHGDHRLVEHAEVVQQPEGDGDAVGPVQDGLVERRVLPAPVGVVVHGVSVARQRHELLEVLLGDRPGAGGEALADAEVVEVHRHLRFGVGQSRAVACRRNLPAADCGSSR